MKFGIKLNSLNIIVENLVKLLSGGYIHFYCNLKISKV